MRYLRNTLAILATTALTALVLYTAVELTSGVAYDATGTSPTAVASAGQTYLCPMTGCSSTSCHAVNGTAAQGSSSAAASAPSGTMTCPRTGCTASTCHGATGSPPPSGGSGGYRNRSGYNSEGMIFE